MSKAQETINRLNQMNLSDRAKAAIEACDLTAIEELFGDCETVEDVESMALELAPTWYAVMKDHDDNDWGYGSYNLSKAKEMCLAYPEGYIAVIEDGRDPVCIDEIEREDF